MVQYVYMTQEEQPQRLFAVTIFARRPPDAGDPEMALESSLIFSLGDPDIPNAWWDYARETYPEAAGWKDHKVVWIEINQGTMLGPFRLNWSVENIATEVEQ